MLKINGLINWEKLVLCVGISVGELMFLGLLLNTLLPYFQIKDPLSTKYLILGINFLLIALIAVGSIFLTTDKSTIKNTSKFRLKIPTSIVFTVIPIFSILGSIRLNNGYSNSLSLLSLFMIAISVIVIYIFRNKFSDSKIAFVIYIFSISVLLMTSLRGWFVVGHDIRKEYQVFQITNINHLWKMNSFQDPYNSCLSITILPTIFSNLINISPSYVYKLLFQIIFAVVPVVIFLSLRKITNSYMAFLSSFLFISFPTFIQDITMINRQEIAFLFFSLIIFLVTNTQIGIKKRKILSIFFVMCLVVSHYSTSYLTFIIFSLTYIFSFLYSSTVFNKLLIPFIHKSNFKTKSEASIITFAFIIIFGLSIAIWNGQITKTLSGPTNIVKNILISITETSSNNTNLSDTFISSLFSKRITSDQTVVLNKYKTDVIGLYSKIVPFIPIQESPIDTTKLSYETNSPLKPFGLFLKSLNLDIFSLNYYARRIETNLIQIFLVFGVVIWVLNKKYKAQNNYIYFITISLLSIIFLLVLLPNISMSYGIVRFLQQAFVLLSLPVLLFVSKLPTFRNDSAFLPTIYSILFFIIMSGLLPEITGGFIGQISLNNYGAYYDRYYLNKAEIQSDSWLLSVTKPKDVIYSDNTIQLFDPLNRHNLIYRNELLTTSVSKNSYLYLSQSNFKLQRYSVLYLGETIYYNLDNSLFYKYKNTIYNNGDSAILE